MSGSSRRRRVRVGALLIATSLGLVITVPMAGAEESTTTTDRARTSTTSTTSTTMRNERTVVVPTTQPPARTTPGVYVEEIASFGESMVQAPAGVPLIIGVGQRSAGDVPVSSVAEFTALVPGAGASLADAVRMFFANGGTNAFVRTTTDSSAASIFSALSQPIPNRADLVLCVDLLSVNSIEWLTLASSMGRLAAASHAIALVDPPSATVAQVSSGAPTPLIALGSELRTSIGSDADAVFLLGSNLVTASGAIIPATPAAAGLVAANDANDGFWNQPFGFGNPIADVRPQFAPTRLQMGQMNVAGLAPLMYFVGRGTTIASNRLLAGLDAQFSEQHAIDVIHTSIANGLQSYVFAPNDANTWSMVTQATTGFMQQLFEQGAFFGASASEAFLVECGLGTTMTSQDILNGFMILAVQFRLMGPDATTRLTFQLQLQATG